MITRIRIVGIKPGALDEYRDVSREWRDLLHKYGGRVLGFYSDAPGTTVIGVAEYESRARLEEIQSQCEADPAFPSIKSRADALMTSFEEKILDKLELGS